MVAHNFKIPPKAPNRKACGKCEGCKREFGYQPCESVPKPRKLIPPKTRLISNTSNDFAAVCFLALFGAALFLVGFIFGLSISEVK